MLGCDRECCRESGKDSFVCCPVLFCLTMALLASVALCLLLCQLLCAIVLLLFVFCCFVFFVLCLVFCRQEEEKLLSSTRRCDCYRPGSYNSRKSQIDKQSNERIEIEKK